MKSDFIVQPPHPETEWAACTSYSESAVRIERLIDVPLKDASICKGPDHLYYLTGTADGATVQVWTSTDLKTWTEPAAVWNLEQEGTWHKERAGTTGICAPKLRYVKGTFWVTYGLVQGGTGLLKSTSNSVIGPYLDMGKMTTDGQDASLFEEEDGAVYWVYRNGQIARMKEDMTGLAEIPRMVEVKPWKIAGREDDPSYTSNLQVGTYGAFYTNRTVSTICSVRIHFIG